MKTTATVETNELNACVVWQSITWSTQDTDQTIKEVKENNAAREAYCNVDGKTTNIN